LFEQEVKNVVDGISVKLSV